MNLPDMTVRNEYGSADLVAFTRRDNGEQGVELREWERRAAALALHRMGWHTERVAHAVGLHRAEVVEAIELRWRPKPLRINMSDAEKHRRVRERRRERLAERTRRNGHWYHPDAPHGTPGGYTNYGCHCTPCRTARRHERGRE